MPDDLDGETLDATPGLVATARSDEFAAGSAPAAAPVAGVPARIDRYQVRRALGQGGMGVVVAAWDPQLEREVAIKLVRGATDEGAQRLVREARAMARLRHPAVLTVHDAGIIAGQVYVVMELVDGEDLARWLERRPPWREALARCRVAGDGLAAAHAVGLVHRDFKPANVLCGRDGRVQVADFGLARTSPGVAEAPSALTGAGAVMGTPAYMAPEQHLAETVGPAADQFAFAATVYESVYGQRPFSGTTLVAFLAELLSGTVRPPPANTTVPGEIGAVVMRGLARDAGDRWPTLQAMLDALDAALAPTVVSAAASAAARWTPATRRIAAVAGGGGLVMASVAVWLAIGRDRGGAASEIAVGVAPPADAPAATPADARDATGVASGTATDAAAEVPGTATRWGPAPALPADRMTRFDPITDRPLMDARVHAWMPDAFLSSLVTVGVRPDGTADLTAGAFVQYAYVSPARSTGDDLRALGRCTYTIYVKDGAIYEAEGTNTECDQLRDPGSPRCGLIEIWRRARADGADPARPAHIEYLRLSPSKPRARWLFQQKALAKSYDDDC